MPRAIQFDPTASFTTSQVSATNQYTKLYLPFDSSVTADGSPENVSVTSHGQASLNSSIKKVGASSLNLSESSGADYLTFPTMALTGDFTIEGFFRTTMAQTGSAPGTRQALFTYSIYNNVFNSYAGLLFWLQGEGSLRLYASNGGNNWNVASNLLFGSITTNSWHHFALCREGSTVRGYFDGSRTINQTMSAFHTSNSNTALGARNTGGDYGFNGQIDDFRILSGLALYTGSSLTVPTSPVTADVTTTVDETRSYASVFNLRSQYKERAAGNWPTVFDSRISLYLPFDVDVQDDSSYSHSVTATGCGVSTAQVKYGAQSLDMASNTASGNVATEYLTIPDHSSFDFGSGDFTVTAWVNLDSSAGNKTSSVVLNKSVSGASINSSFYFGAGKDGASIYTSTSGTAWNGTSLESSTSITPGNWVHLAWVRSGNVFRIFQNGTQTASTTASITIYTSTRDVDIGRQSTSGSAFKGYIDDLRVIKGHAEYSSNFTPPTGPSGGVI